MVDVQGIPGPNGPSLSVNWEEDPALDNAETRPAWGGKTSARAEHTG